MSWKPLHVLRAARPRRSSTSLFPLQQLGPVPVCLISGHSKLKILSRIRGKNRGPTIFMAGQERLETVSRTSKSVLFELRKGLAKRKKIVSFIQVQEYCQFPTCQRSQTGRPVCECDLHTKQIRAARAMLGDDTACAVPRAKVMGGQR
ncbi:hypothetical protein BaRGS_00006546 [Batillaria attramentaria]|uniref:Uncharacterized protein n=1 Tax=Batillaria attramentaria TaxID=370345 RepID=A0ABD0LTA9_9CAEN